MCGEQLVGNFRVDYFQQLAPCRAAAIIAPWGWPFSTRAAKVVTGESDVRESGPREHRIACHSDLERGMARQREKVVTGHAWDAPGGWGGGGAGVEIDPGGRRGAS